jgi:uncharacterized protein
MNNPDLKVRETSSGLEIHLHVLPRAKRSELAGVYNGALKLKITAPPVDDAANRAIIDFFSKMLDLPKSCLNIQAGAKSRDKTFHIKGLTLRRFLELISEKNTSR